MTKLLFTLGLCILTLGVVPAPALAAGGHGGGSDSASPAPTRRHEMARASDESAAGRPGDPAKVSRTIEITMEGMRFVPDTIEVKAGETIRFFHRNLDAVPHEMVIGTPAELKEHAAMMRKMPVMEHAEPNMITVGPGQRGGLVWQFDKPGTVPFACLIPGHLEAGMKGRIEVRG